MEALDRNQGSLSWKPLKMMSGYVFFSFLGPARVGDLNWVEIAHQEGPRLFKILLNGPLTVERDLVVLSRTKPNTP